MSSHHTHIHKLEAEAQGVRAGARGSNPGPRDCKALPEEPSRTAEALIQWLPNACDGEPFLAEPLLALGAEEQSGDTVLLPWLEESLRGPWSVCCCQSVEGEVSWGQTLPLPCLSLAP